jgi:dTDP-4-dehydrorhamnose reductase
MVWLITGASGQLGLAMQRVLSTRGISFIAANSKELDITSQNSVESVLLRNSPKVIVNCAAWTDVDLAEIKQEQAYNVNALAVKNLALASKRINAKLVHVSTDYVFSGVGNSPWLESAERDPASIYGLSKREGENFVLEIYGENSFVVRTAWLYSENGKNFAKTMANLALSDEREVRVVNDQIGQPTSANDLAQQIVDLVESKSTHGIYHGTSSGQATWFEFAQKIFELVGANTERVVPVSSDEFLSLAKRPRYSVLGHDNWRKSELPEMRDWRLALVNEIPRILFAQRRSL